VKYKKWKRVNKNGAPEAIIASDAIKKMMTDQPRRVDLKVWIPSRSFVELNNHDEWIVKMYLRSSETPVYRMINHEESGYIANSRIGIILEAVQSEDSKQEN